MKKIYKVVFVLITIIASINLIYTKVNAYGGEEHKDLVTASFSTLQQEKNNAYIFYNNNYCDTEGMAEDLSHKGHHGNGDYQLKMMIISIT